MNSFPGPLGQRLRRLRQSRHLSMAKLAEALGCSTDYVWKLETGRARPSLSFLNQIAAFFGVDPATLIRPAGQHELPADLQEFVTREDSLPYLVLAKELEEARLPPEMLRNLIEAVRLAAKNLNKTEE